MTNGTLRVLPLGGLGEIGKNMMVVEYGGRILVVDTGLMFPTPDQLGIDLVLPDFTYLRERAEDIEAIVLTHGHEDHVGALPFVLRELDRAPVVYGGPLTAAMVRSKLDEHRLKDVQIEDGLRDLYQALTVTTNPIPVKTAMNLAGHELGGLRLPLVDASEEETAVIREALERHKLLAAVS